MEKEESKEGALDFQKILFKIAHEHASDISFEVPLKWSVATIKKFIELKHPLKPPASQQKLFFAGRVLANQDVLKDILSQVRLPY